MTLSAKKATKPCDFFFFISYYLPFLYSLIYFNVSRWMTTAQNNRDLFEKAFPHLADGRAHPKSGFLAFFFFFFYKSFFFWQQNSILFNDLSFSQ